MPVKFNHYYTIHPHKKSEYGRFMINEFIPQINKLGMHAVAGWSVMVGAYSEIIFETASSDLDLIESALRNPKYREINARLLNYVKKYKTKVLVNTSRKDSYSTDFKEETIKFNQMWDVVSEKRSEYERFTSETFYPALESMGISIANEWEVLIGEGPRIICEGRADDPARIIENLRSKKFRSVLGKLKEYVENYESRLLSFHIRKVKGYKSASYDLIEE